MYKVLIVDDEALVRIGIKSFIQWDELGLVLIGEASNGREALQIIEAEYPEIILLDIKMPEMDGIELLKAMNRRKISARVIVLSCHDDYEYVREALKLGAIDYILKLSLKPDKLKDLLLKTVNSILDSPFVIKEYEEDILNVYIKKILTNETCSNIDLDSKKIIDFNNRIDSLSNILCMIKLQCDEQRKRDAAYNVVKEVIKDYKKSICTNYSADKILILVSEVSDIKGIEEMNELAERIVAVLKSYLEIKALAGISNIFTGMGKISESLRQCIHSLDYMFYIDNIDVINYRETKPMFEKNNLNSRELMENLSKFIELCDGENTFSTIDFLFGEIICTGNITPDAVKVCAIEIINLFSSGLRLYNLSFPDMGVVSPYIEISNKTNIYKLKEYMLDFSIEYFSFLNDFNKTKLRNEISIAKNYIIENFSKDINLSMIARMINISENYFSTIFKKETGMNFIDYINKIRIQKARELLISNRYKASEVAYMVGYNSVSYFSKIFKKITGFNPSDLSRIK